LQGRVRDVQDRAQALSEAPRGNVFRGDRPVTAQVCPRSKVDNAHYDIVNFTLPVVAEGRNWLGLIEFGCVWLGDCRGGDHGGWDDIA
jgi:hypothetical protein